ncbi:hypothetical protein [Flavobacterium sp.]|uniref:hypothetical protein n=1 Tax=Flavobacterium sp. TaxID=239 RepID=UPI00260CED1D|nr:hypothetical protein [Flavobacterium sp.]
MKKIIYSFLLCSAALLVSCGKDDSDEAILNYTTDQTLGIVKINLEQLDGKLPKKEMMNDQSGNFSKEEKEKMALLMNAKDNGIDIAKPVYLVADQENNGFVFSMFCWLDNSSKFESNFSKITGSKIRIDKTKNLVYANNQLVGSVKDEMLVMSRFMSNPYGGSVRPAGDAMPEKFFTDLWNRKSLANEGKVEQITKSLGNKSDASMWLNLHGIISVASRGYIESLAINKLLIDAGIGFDMNFGEGDITFNSNTFFNKDLQKEITKYYNGKSADYSIVKSIDLDKAKSYAVGYMSFEFMQSMMKQAGFEAIANNYLAERNITMADITAGLNGSYAYASLMEDNTATDEMDPYAYKMPKTIFALGINGSKADKLINLINSEPMLNTYAKMYHDKNVMVFGTDENDLALLKAGKSAANTTLKKKSDVVGYSWAGGDDVNVALNSQNRKVKVVNMESTYKVKDGNFTSETTVKLDKKDKNAIHYLLGYE